MSHFLLPSVPYNNGLPDAVCSAYCDIETEEISINKTLCGYLNNIKAEIDSRQTEWNKYKKYTNSYGIIH